MLIDETVVIQRAAMIRLLKGLGSSQAEFGSNVRLSEPLTLDIILEHGRRDWPILDQPNLTLLWKIKNAVEESKPIEVVG